MTNTDTTFFTNEEWQYLIDRFKISLSNNTKFFDVLVWYFRSSWFYNLYEALHNVEKIRILVWINVDNNIFEIIDLSKKWKQEIKDSFSINVEEEFKSSDDNINIEIWVRKFVEFIKNWKLEIRAYPDKIHSKVYIIRKDNIKDQENYWKVITWSSNFSESWLKWNLEFNVELKDRRDVEFALEKFEDLWKKWVELTKEYIDSVENNTWLNDDISPHDLYLKFLYEYFWDRVNDDKNILDWWYLPDGFMELRYQQDAVKDILNRLRKYNWVFLADVVWLWKTYISALVWQYLKWWILIVCPPHLKEYWEQTFFDFKVSCKVESLWKLNNILKEWHEKYKYIFIDEAHRFRNDWTQSYDILKQLCINKKVILVSATPFNNNFNDLYSLITLFQPTRNSSIPNIKNLEVFFKKINQDLKKIDKKENYDEYLDLLQKSSDIVREKILKQFMIRRTRKEIETYFKDDIQKQWLKFPKVEDPKKIMYKFDENLDNMFNWTIEILKKINYARYNPANYIDEQESDKKINQIEKIWQSNLKWFMKTLIVKRLESSFHSFKNTIDRIIKSYEQFYAMYKKWDVYISKKIDIYDFMENDNIDELFEYIEKWDVIHYKKEQFRNDNELNFWDDLLEDLKLFKEIHLKWLWINYDPKLEQLKNVLNNYIKDQKVIIFSESKETVEYLYESLNSIYNSKIIYYSAQWSSLEKDYIFTIKKNFDPKYWNDENKYNILITTDILAEWINLHKSNIVINYDIPWNPTRVLQRIWRINRVWTTHNSIFIYNFFPTIQWNNEIQLEENVKSKMEAFITLLWTDAKYLTENENIQWHNLFDKLNSSQYLNSEDCEDIEKSELKYLNEIRKIRDTDEQLFKKIRKLPRKSRSWRQLENLDNSLLTFFKKWDCLKTFLTDFNDSKELSFEEAIKILECKKDEKKQNIQLDSYYQLLTKNKNSFSQSLKEEDVSEHTINRWRSNESELIKILELIKWNWWLIDSEEIFFNQLLRSLRNWNFTKSRIKLIKNELIKHLPYNNPTKIYYKLLDLVPPEFLKVDTNSKLDEWKIEVILNEYII